MPELPIDGDTSHNLEAITDGSSWDLLNTFTLPASEGDILIWETGILPGPVYRSIRVTTLVSPSWVSWREVEVMGK